MEIQVKATHQGHPARRARPLPDPLRLLANGSLALYHAGCRGHVSVAPDDERDIQAYATVRCNLCFESHREKQSAIARALRDVLTTGERSNACTLLTFVGLSPREVLARTPIATRIQRFFLGDDRRR